MKDTINEYEIDKKSIKKGYGRSYGYPKLKKKVKKILECECCNNEITQEDFGGKEIWKSNKYLFCSIDCCASWFAENLYGEQIDDEEYEEYLKDYGK